MDQLAQVTQTIALTLGVAWASGINLYAAILTLGILGASGNATLPPGLEVLANPVVIAAAGVMYVVEFVADKIPGVDSGWDVVHTFIRIPAGALLAYEASGHVDPAVALAAALVGGMVAGTMHVTKAGTRLLINASPEPFSNSIASLTEDGAVIGGMWLALHHPAWFLVLFVLLGVFLVWALPKLWRGIRLLASRALNFLRGRGLATATAGADAAGGDARGLSASSPASEDQRPTV
jgi:hypothetical protein